MKVSEIKAPMPNRRVWQNVHFGFPFTTHLFLFASNCWRADFLFSLLFLSNFMDIGMVKAPPGHAARWPLRGLLREQGARRWRGTIYYSCSIWRRYQQVALYRWKYLLSS